MESSHMHATMVSADFNADTLTLEMHGSYYAAAGEFVLLTREQYDGMVKETAALRTYAPGWQRLEERRQRDIATAASVRAPEAAVREEFEVVVGGSKTWTQEEIANVFGIPLEGLAPAVSL